MRALLPQSGLPIDFWAEAMRAAVQIKNMVPTRSITSGVSPHQVYTGKAPNISRLRVFGSVATVLKPATSGKLDSKVTKCGVLCYGGHGKYRLFDATESRVKIASYRDITFFERQFLTKQETSTSSLLTSDVGIDASSTDLVPKVFGPDLPTKAQKRITKGNRAALKVNAARLPEKAYVHGEEGFMETDALGDPKSYKAAHAGTDSENWTKAEI